MFYIVIRYVKHSYQRVSMDKNKRTIQKSMYFTPEEFKKIQLVAFIRHRSMSEMIRSEILDLIEPEYQRHMEKLNGKNNGYKND